MNNTGEVLMMSEGCPPLDMDDPPPDEVWEDSHNLPVVKLVLSGLNYGDEPTTVKIPLKSVAQKRRTWGRGTLTTLKLRGWLPVAHCGTRVDVDDGRWSGVVVSMETVWSSVTETSLLLG